MAMIIIKGLIAADIDSKQIYIDTKQKINSYAQLSLFNQRFWCAVMNFFGGVIMAGSLQQSMAQTVYCYKNIILPKLKTLLKSQYEIFSIEADKSELARLLDRYGGCDLFLLDKRNLAIEGVASRIQFTEKSFDTFTIRLQRDNGIVTEYEKRRKAIASGSIYPRAC